jgi:hypothetical protein
MVRFNTMRPSQDEKARIFLSVFLYSYSERIIKKRIGAPLKMEMDFNVSDIKKSTKTQTKHL